MSQSETDFLKFVAMRERAEKAEAARYEMATLLGAALGHAENVAELLNIPLSDDRPDIEAITASIERAIKGRVTELERLKEGIREAASVFERLLKHPWEVQRVALDFPAWLAAYCPIPDREAENE